LEHGIGNSVLVVDISNTRKPKVVSRTYIDFGKILDIEVNGDYIYLASLADGLMVLKDNFGKLTYIGQSIITDIHGRNLVVEKRCVYMACGYSGLTIFKAFTSLQNQSILLITAAVIAVVIIAVLVYKIKKSKYR